MKHANVTIRIQNAVKKALTAHPVSDPALKNKLEFALLCLLEDTDADDKSGTPASWTRRVLSTRLKEALDADSELKELFNEAGPTAMRAYRAHTSKGSAPLSASLRLQRLAGVMRGEANSEADENEE